MFTCFSVIPVIVKIPTRAASARARLGSNDGEGGHMGTTKRHTAPGTCRKGELGRATVIIVRPTQAQFLRRESRKARVLAPSSHLALQLAPTSRRPAASTQTTSWEAKRIHHVHDAGSAQTRAHVAPRQSKRTDVHYSWPRKSWWRRKGSAVASRGGGAPRDGVWWWRRRQLGGRCWEKEARTSSISAPRRHGDRRRAIQLYHQHWSTQHGTRWPPGFTLTAPLDVTLDGRE